jgi:hypothetical protein
MIHNISEGFWNHDDDPVLTGGIYHEVIFREEAGIPVPLILNEKKESKKKRFLREIKEEKIVLAQRVNNMIQEMREERYVSNI